MKKRICGVLLLIIAVMFGGCAREVQMPEENPSVKLEARQFAESRLHAHLQQVLKDRQKESYQMDSMKFTVSGKRPDIFVLQAQASFKDAQGGAAEPHAWGVAVQRLEDGTFTVYREGENVTEDLFREETGVLK